MNWYQINLCMNSLNLPFWTLKKSERKNSTSSTFVNVQIRIKLLTDLLRINILKSPNLSYLRAKYKLVSRQQYDQQSSHNMTNSQVMTYTRRLGNRQCLLDFQATWSWRQKPTGETNLRWRGIQNSYSPFCNSPNIGDRKRCEFTSQRQTISLKTKKSLQGWIRNHLNLWINTT